jgi:hypothetical protein
MSDPGDDLGEFLEAIGKVKVAPRRRPSPEEQETYRVLDDLDDAHRATGVDRSIYSRAAAAIRRLAAREDIA